MVGLQAEIAHELVVRLLLLSPSVAAIGVLTAAFTLGSKRGGLLPALISLPLFMPLVIFATGLSGGGALLLLAAFALVVVPGACWVSAALLRLS
jgi:heme exporter protein B